MTSPLGVRPSIPVGTLMSIFDPLFLGIDEFGTPVYLPLAYRNLLAGGEPGAGKSSLLNTIVGHAALCHDVALCLLDGKQVELGLWEHCADVFVGPDLDLAILTLHRLQTVMDNRLLSGIQDADEGGIDDADVVRQERPAGGVPAGRWSCGVAVRGQGAGF
jgi:S-DNA-T family DNA segregation ATPase FtsK/SpoIIIE